MDQITAPRYQTSVSQSVLYSFHTTRSSLFLMTARGLRYSFIFIVQIILMNLLTPSDFGLVRIAAVVIGIFDLVNEMGISYALVQRNRISETELSSAFSLNLLTGGLLYVIFFFCAPVSGSVFSNPKITGLVRLGSFASFFGSISVVHRSVLQRNLRYERMAIIEVTSAFAGAVTSVLMAVSGWGVWSLLASTFVYNIISSLLFMTTISWPSGNYMNPLACKSLFFFGGTIVLQRILNYGVQNFDSLIVGKYLGEQSLGIYSIAVTIITLPQAVLGIIVDTIFLSVFSRLQNDNKRLAASFLKSNEVTSTLLLPFFIIVFSFPKEIMSIICLFNNRNIWIQAATPIRILSLLGLLFIFSSFTSILWLAKGKVKLRLWWEMVGLFTIAYAVIIGKTWGIQGICSAIVIAGLLIFLLHLNITKRVIGIGPLYFITILLPSVICGSGMLIFNIILSSLFPGDSLFRNASILTAGAVAGLLIYYMIMSILFKNTRKTLCEIFRMIINKNTYSLSMPSQI